VREKEELTVFRYKDYPVVRWKNGQGISREVITSFSEGENFDWRLSLADISQSGEFSEYKGYQRLITLVEGDGCGLIFGEGKKKDLTQLHEPFSFDGGLPLRCNLYGGATKNLNLMVRQDCITARWTVCNIGASEKVELEGDNIHIFFCLRGTFQFIEAATRSPFLEEWDSAKLYRKSNAVISINAEFPAKFLHIKLSGS